MDLPRFPVLDRASFRMKAQVQAAEDGLIFDALDRIALLCGCKSLSGEPILLSKCINPECIARYVMEQ